MTLAVALLDKTINPWVFVLGEQMKGFESTRHVLIHDEDCPLFKELWPRRGVHCLYLCVNGIACAFVSDAANCPFALYPMGSGMSLVTACSLIKRPSRHGSPT